MLYFVRINFLFKKRWIRTAFLNRKDLEEGFFDEEIMTDANAVAAFFAADEADAFLGDADTDADAAADADSFIILFIFK